ncbi:4'-phosphopantetheinyl transferase superfamily protein [Peribacillus sp. ACCC06369]|uniref:4'-phosphopantetheinyl transferase family protein n=1 Tax=Peribacillus sp. ACCC06369 TaxID=3055860 RepID=UPI0025A04A94|nr:4'-phosphopantetheinyl transferase superfamily protein [Peribacillus sp. ACCC06369]MDM5357290.1 4'-phosphopantetheinyl transferase superfamily protein [Peribacillus sp. ACCC06369]
MKILALKLPINLNENTYEEMLHLLPKQRRLSIHKLQKKNDKYRSLFGELLAKWFISDILRKPFQNIHFILDKHGKPNLVGGRIHFNITHSGDWVVVGIHKDPIGVDIEEVKDFNIHEITKSTFSSKEFSYFIKLPKAKQIDIFFKMWTLKESWLKCIGTGFLVSPNTFSILNGNNQYSLEIPTEEILKLKTLGVKITDMSNYLFKSYHLSPGYPISVCINNRNEDHLEFPDNIDIIKLTSLINGLKAL